MRKLASVQTILKLEPIEGRDRIELATILGWRVITNKGFNVGDLVVYVEVDSILPERAEFEFLRKNCYSEKKGGFFIRTMKLANTLSQGIIFPLSILGKITEENGKIYLNT